MSVITAVVLHSPSVSYNNAFKFQKTPFFSHIWKMHKSSRVGLGQPHNILYSCLSAACVCQSKESYKIWVLSQKLILW